MSLQPKLKSHRGLPRPPFERVALLLQGGGALGAYQGGVYQALSEADLHPDWVAGISIGAINSSLIAGNAPEHRVAALRRFWETVSEPPMRQLSWFPMFPARGDAGRLVQNQASALGTLMFGAPGFFTPRMPPPFMHPPGSPEALSYYDVAPVKSLLESLADFDRINHGGTRFSVGAVNVRSGNFVYFDSTTHHIRTDHVIASGSLPPGFPATEIDGEFYWDGGIVSNTPLDWVLDSRPRVDTLAFQVDLWNARGDMPRSLVETEVRQKEIRFSSRTRASTTAFRKQQLLRRAFARLMTKMPPELLETHEARTLAAEADERVFNIVQLIYRSTNYESVSKDFEFSRRTMEDHWTSGYNDAVRTLLHPEVTERPNHIDGVFTFDLARQGRD